MRDDLLSQLEVLLADTYAIYLKTQNYHWHVTGPQFKALHQLFEEHYMELADAVDAVAEQIRIMDHLAPATFKDFERLKTIKDSDSSVSANQMVSELANDHKTLVKDLNRALKLAEEIHDEGAANLLSDRVSAHEKAGWMLRASREA
ncbi:MAG: DNA starvation/stationary phase protection protein [Gammaproteobacteria bacterium]|nr:DNA starvation/stationary phase protection protein [Gammaproteobacteria bacterium]